MKTLKMNSVAILILVLSCMLLHTAARRCPSGFKRRGRSCYWFSRTKGNFGYAYSVCKFLRARLAIISSRGEMKYLQRQARRAGRITGFFIGGSDLGRERKWLWSSGRRVRGLTWARKQPNNAWRRQHCLMMWRTKNYFLNDYRCGAKLNFICEKR